MREHWHVFTGFSALALALGIFACALTPNESLKGLILGVVLAAVPDFSGP
jgi:hypothetical protein